MPEIIINNKKFLIAEVYQNVYGTDIKSVRDCYERYRTILTADCSFNYDALENSTVCDIGCNLGYFFQRSGSNPPASGRSSNSEFDRRILARRQVDSRVYGSRSFSKASKRGFIHSGQKGRDLRLRQHN